MKSEELLALQSSSITASSILALLPRTELIEHLEQIAKFQYDLIQTILEGKECDLKALSFYDDRFFEMAIEAEKIFHSNHIYKKR